MIMKKIRYSQYILSMQSLAEVNLENTPSQFSFARATPKTYYNNFQKCLFQINDYMWSRSIEIEPRSSDTLKRRNCERRWPGLSLKSPGIRPKGLPGKNHPNPLPKIGSRHSKDENVSPLGSPSFGSPVAVFKQSPVSTPVTPSYQTSPRESDSSLRFSFSQLLHRN